MIVGLVMIMYFASGVFIIDATKIIIMLFLVDFVLLTIASDNAKPSKLPETYPFTLP
jgi:hypothetical protein